MIEDAVEVGPVTDCLRRQLLRVWFSFIEASLVFRLAYLRVCMKYDIAVPVLPHGLVSIDLSILANLLRRDVVPNSLSNFIGLPIVQLLLIIHSTPFFQLAKPSLQVVDQGSRCECFFTPRSDTGPEVYIVVNG